MHTQRPTLPGCAATPHSLCSAFENVCVGMVTSWCSNWFPCVVHSVHRPVHWWTSGLCVRSAAQAEKTAWWRSNTTAGTCVHRAVPLLDVAVQVHTPDFPHISPSPFSFPVLPPHLPITFSHVILHILLIVLHIVPPCSPILYSLPIFPPLLHPCYHNLVARQQVQNRHVPRHATQRILPTWWTLYICTFTRGDASVSYIAGLLYYTVQL